jgi:uncharacterized membrane protein
MTHYAKYGKATRTLVILLCASLILYYIFTHAVGYFRYTKAVYTGYFWYRAPWLLVHVTCGVVTTLIGPLQFIPAIRTYSPSLHRTLGKIYLGCVALSTFVSFYLVSTSGPGIVYSVGLAMLGIVWLSSSLAAWWSIRKGNIGLHREWMIKSYVLTLSFVTFRFAEDLLARAGVSDFIGRKILLAWCCWVIPLVITEFVLNLRRLHSYEA